MAVNEKAESVSGSASRRWFFGTNVLVLFLLVVFLVVGVNWIGHRHNVRRDMVGGFGGSRLSERAKRILEKAGPDLRITTVYTSDEPETDRKKYFSKLEDLAQEIQQLNKNVKVQHLFSGNERAELRDRVQGKFGSAVSKYNEVVTLATGVWSDLETTVGPIRTEMEALLQDPNSWLSGFSTMANNVATLRNDQKNVEQTRKEVNDLVHGEGLPRYQEANTKIKAANDDLKKHLEETQKWMQEMQKLAKVLSDQNSDFAVKSRAKVKELGVLAAQLKQAAGDPKDQNVPDDAKPILQEVAKEAMNLANWLVEESGRVDVFLKANPALARHPKWVIQIPQGPFLMEVPLNALVADTAQNLSQVSQRLRQFLKQEIPKDQLQGLVRQLRGLGQEVGDKLGAWNTGLIAILDEGGKINEKSKEMQFLAKGGNGDLFKATLGKLNDVATKITELPALKLDEINNRLTQDNIVVVENDKDVKVVTFDELWPVADPMASQFGASSDEQPGQRRVFAGDSPIISAVLTMQVEKPFATVIFVVYETEPNPQMRQFGGRKSVGPVPLSEINTLKEKLDQANFKTKEWNLGGEGDAAKRPEPEAGTQAVYVLLPPAPAPQQNFMMQQAPEKGFGEEQLKKVREALEKEGKAIFMASFEPPRGPFAPPPEYDYGKYLVDTWGIKVDPTYRVIRGVVDKREPDHYGINLMQWYYMQLSSFTKQPMGEPLRNRRVLVREVCTVTKAGEAPAGVKLTPVLEVSENARDYWAEKDIGRIIKALRSPDSNASFTQSPEAMKPPFSVIMAGENDAKKSKVVVMGTAMSFRDDYLSQRVMRIEGKNSRLTTDPPPTENVDLFVNALYWLIDKPDLIGAGPAALPLVPAIEASGRNSMFLVTFGWAVAVLVAGGVVMMVRRK